MVAQRAFKQFFRSRAIPIGLTGSFSLSLQQAAQLEETKKDSNADETARPYATQFIGIFLEKESLQKLREKYPLKFRVANDGSGSYVVFKYNPSDDENETFAPLMGHAARLKVEGYTEDDFAQVVLVNVTTESGEPIEFDGGAEYPHILLSSAEGHEGFNSASGNLLLERLHANDKLAFLLHNTCEEGVPKYSGELPIFKSKNFPLFNPFPATKVKVNREKDTIELKGTICSSTSFDFESGKCSVNQAKAECGFCKFMKAGPCGKEFSAWEACLDKAKANGDDFIEKCGKETLALRDCVDANPEYYSILNETPSEESDENKEVKEEETSKH
jgi:hypothetical protein